MKNYIIMFLALTAITGFFISCGTTKDVSNSKPIILIAAFGSSYESGQANLNDFDQAVVKAFPGYDVRWGFTATFIVNKLKKAGVETVFDRNIKVQTLDEAINEIREEGNTQVVVQSLHLMVGAEFRQVLDSDFSGLNVKFSYPLLFKVENIETVIKALDGEIARSSDSVTIFCAHGNEAHPEYNAELVSIDNYLRANYTNTYLATMEGNPEFNKVKEEVMVSGVKNIKFITFMLSFGDHMTNDVMGGEEDSMKTQLGLPAEVSDGLASLPLVQEIFINSMKEALKQF